MYSIYKITSSKSGKSYIGLTKQTVETRFRQHVSDAKTNRGRTALGGAIRKYGEESFCVKVIGKAPCLKSAMRTEIEEIARHGTQRPKGYNITEGGEAGFNWMTSEQRKAASKAVGLKLKGYKHNKEFGRSISRTKKGVPLTAENLKSIRESKGRWVRCLNNEEVFFGVEGYREFANKYGLNPKSFSSVVSVCKGRRLSTGGMRFEYADGEKNNPRERTTKKKPVTCLDTGVVFCSVTAAVEWLRESGRPKAATSFISKCCKGVHDKAYGYKWGYFVNSKD